MPETRLHINLTEGIIEAEGNPAFVRIVYEDFKGRIAALDDGSKAKPPRKKPGEGRPR